MFRILTLVTELIKIRLPLGCCLLCPHFFHKDINFRSTTESIMNVSELSFFYRWDKIICYHCLFYNLQLIYMYIIPYVY